MRSGVILWLLLLLGTSAVQATEVASASVENDDELVESAADTTESSVDLLSVLYKRCWTQCWDGFRDSTGQKNMLYLAQHGFDMDDHEEYCREYNSTRACVRSCVDKRTDLKYLRPFFRRNYLNEIICFKNYNDFRTHLQCYRNEHRQLEFFFVRCGYFAVDERIDKPQINRQTCSSLSCVLRSIPQIVRRVCESPAAADFMERMVEAFLRERIKLRKMKMLCRRQTLFF